MLSQQNILELSSTHLPATSIAGIKTLAGGCADVSLKIETTKESFFLKCYTSQSTTVEAEGLDILRKSTSIKIPEIVGYGIKDEYNYLILEWVQQGQKCSTYWKKLGEGLAELHRNSQPKFGFHHDNYIGRLHQTNTENQNWVDFFIERRLVPQLRLAQNKLSSGDLRLFDDLLHKLPDILHFDRPALIHGDLWSGNVLTTLNSEPALIDPAVYYGNREIEIAFTYLFGGFNDEFYNVYRSSFPLEKDFEKRIELYNLYPLLVHVNMFGGGYIGQVQKTLRNYS